MLNDLKIFYSDNYTLPLPEGHRFPNEKYKLLRLALLEQGILKEKNLFESPVASFDELVYAHSAEYVQSIRDGSVSTEIIKRIGFPWSLELYLKAASTVGGALQAALAALDFGVSGNLAGGTHHAHYDRGEGYCIFNDQAVVTNYLLENKYVKKVAILDLDVHQGNGNSSILGDKENVFIVSVHGEKNYPFKKIPSHLDIGLEDNAGDLLYLEAVKKGLSAIEQFKPDIILYQMGVDALEFDSLGKLKVSYEGLIQRDENVFRLVKDKKIPISLALGGGYSKPISHSIQAYLNTYRTLIRIFGS
ncbi:MAG: histone deacetylase [Bdellovibrionales bacterium]